jgi:hypothetical protein
MAETPFAGGKASMFLFCSFGVKIGFAICARLFHTQSGGYLSAPRQMFSSMDR